jgi:hypothetical protein
MRIVALNGIGPVRSTETALAAGAQILRERNATGAVKEGSLHGAVVFRIA